MITDKYIELHFQIKPATYIRNSYRILAILYYPLYVMRTALRTNCIRVIVFKLFYFTLLYLLPSKPSTSRVFTTNLNSMFFFFLSHLIKYFCFYCDCSNCLLFGSLFMFLIDIRRLTYRLIGVTLNSLKIIDFRQSTLKRNAIA